MYALSGFVSISALVANAPGVNSMLGELSSRSKTFSREIGYYNNSNHPDVKLVSFNSNRDGALVEVQPEFVTRALEISQFLFLKAIAGELSDDRESCRQQLVNQFGANVDIVEVGAMVTNGMYWLPERINVSSRDVSESNEITLWYSDASFQAQYSYYEVLVVPIVPSLDDLHGSRENALAVLNGITVPYVLNMVDTISGAFPPTEIVSTEYDWVDKNDPTIVKATPWTVIVYGAAGDNVDVIRQALVDYIVANSSEGVLDWEQIYPDLFLPNEFYITPIWDKYSIPNQQTQAGIYSPTIKLSEILQYGIDTFHEIPLEHIQQNLTVTGSVYKSLNFVSVGNHRNRNAVYSFDQLWPQYATISTDRIDFNRLSPATSEFIQLLVQLFMTAENLTEFGTPPVGMSRVQRGSNWYISATYDKMQYLVLLKSSGV